MARKKKAPEHENLERWLVSYADFITLLFAFFVVMYSISSVNEGKYRVLSDSLVAAFRSPTKTLQPIQVGKSSKSPVSSKFQIRQSPFAVNLPDMPLPWVKHPDSKSEEESKGKSSGAGESRSGTETGGPVDEMLKKLMDQGKLAITPQGEAAITAKLKQLIGGKAAQGSADASAAGAGLMNDQVIVMKKIANEVQQAMQKMIDENLIAVRRSQLWVEVEIKASVLFASGDASVNPKAIPVLTQLAKILRPFPNVIRVEGFTDNIPIKNNVYPSNWELSSARAASVVRLFIDHDISPQRLLAVGYGEYHPITDNSTAAGRQKNRRVVLVVLATRAKAKAVNDDLQAKDAKLQSAVEPTAYEDKGIQTPEESPPPVQDKVPGTTMPEVKTLLESPASGKVKATPVEAASAPAPSAPGGSTAASKPSSTGGEGVIRRPPASPVSRSNPPSDTVVAIPPPIQVHPPITLAPPLPLPSTGPVPAPLPALRLTPQQAQEKTP